MKFLQALVTNDLNHLERGRGVHALYLTPQGRMIADMEILHRGAFLCCNVAPVLAAPLAARLDQLIFAEDTRVSDVSAQQVQICIVGGQAASHAAGLFGLEGQAVEALPELAQIDVPGGFLWRSGELSLPSYEIWLDAERRQELIDRLEKAQIAPVSPSLLESLRITEARPAWGADLTETTIPLEAGLLDRAISTSKGCYVGQEVIIRILHRGGGRVAKRLVQLTSDGISTPPVQGSTLESLSGAAIGNVTSVGEALVSDGWIALAYLTREAAAIDAVVKVQSTGGTATVTAFGH